MKMTIEEIQAELDKMPAALIEKGWRTPDASMRLRANVPAYINVSEPYSQDGYKSKIINGDTYAECVAGAWRYIQDLPDAQTTILSNYSRKLADAIDYGHENNVPGKLVDPVRRAQKAVSDMLLPAPVRS